jgi:hypothetical protein
MVKFSSAKRVENVLSHNRLLTLHGIEVEADILLPLSA